MTCDLLAPLADRLTSGAGLEVYNPGDGTLIATVGICDETELAQMIVAADHARSDWARRTAQERADLLRRWHALVLEHLEELAEIVTLESGKPLAEARSEVRYGAGFIEWFAEEGKRAYGEIIPSHHSGKRLLTLRQPVGTCAAITPWNFPVAMITRKVAPALAAGCSMVVKPAEATPLSALFLELLAHRAGIPVGLFAVAPTTDPAMAGRVFCTHPLVRKLSFTGSTRVGKILMAQAAHQITRLSLELGGNAPFLVFDDADLDVAADAVLIPLHCEYFALEGLADLVGTMRRVRAALNPSLDIEGVLLTMFDERTNLGQQVARDIRAFFQDRVYTTVIPRNIRLGEAPSHGIPAILYDAKSRGAEAYLALAREVVARSESAAPQSQEHHG